MAESGGLGAHVPGMMRVLAAEKASMEEWENSSPVPPPEDLSDGELQSDSDLGRKDERILGASSIRDPSPKQIEGEQNEGNSGTISGQNSRRRYSLDEMNRLRHTAGSNCLPVGFASDSPCLRETVLESAQEKDKIRKRSRPKFFEDQLTGIMRTADVLLTGEDANADFEQLLLPPSLLEALRTCSFLRPSPVQLRAIPIGRLGVDLIAHAKSGTGKTLVFSIIAIEAALKRRISSSKFSGPCAVLLAPTREIAIQICDVCQRLCSALNPKVDVAVESFIGGVSVMKNKEQINKGVDIAIGTPGRLKVLIHDGVLRVSSVRLFVLDEADKLLDGTFRETIPWLVRSMPEHAQIATFSATFPKALVDVLADVMREPQIISMVDQERRAKDDHTHNVVLEGVEQLKVVLPENTTLISKAVIACAILKALKFNQCICFSNDKHSGKQISAVFKEAGFRSAFTSGAEPQSLRSEVISAVRENKVEVIVATDLLSRGLDLEQCDVVLNLDIPRKVESYLHRVGRAGRFGTKGVAVCLGREEDVHQLETVLGLNMESLELDVEEILTKQTSNKRQKQEKNAAKAVPAGDDGRGSIVQEDKSTERGNTKTDTQSVEISDGLENPVGDEVNDTRTGSASGAYYGNQDYYPEEWVSYWEGFTAAYRLGRQAALRAIQQSMEEGQNHV